MKVLNQFGQAVYNEFRNINTSFGFKDIYTGDFFSFDLKRYIERPLTDLEFNTIQKYIYGNVLDIGCGTGIHLDYIKRRNTINKVIGIELNQDLIKIGKLFNRGNIIKGDFLTFDFGNDKFDTITIFDNTIGIFNLPFLFYKLKSVLNKNGQVLIFFRKNNQNKKDIQTNYFKGILNNKLSEDEIEIKLYNKKYFRKIAKKYGFNSYEIGEDENSYCLILYI